MGSGAFLLGPRKVWLSCESRGDMKAGDIMDDPPAAAVANDRAPIAHGTRLLFCRGAAEMKLRNRRSCLARLARWRTRM